MLVPLGLSVSSSPPPNPQELAPAVSLPKGGGGLKNIGDKFEANAFTGSGGMSIPIAVSPARDLSPLALGYSTGAGNGPFGMGWQLSVPSISRKTDKGLPTYDDPQESDTFLISDAEDLVPLLEQEGDEWVRKTEEHDGHRVHAYRPRVEGGFARIERWVHLETGDVHWRTLDPRKPALHLRHQPRQPHRAPCSSRAHLHLAHRRDPRRPRQYHRFRLQVRGPGQR